jgi:hypothetical protein
MSLSKVSLPSLALRSPAKTPLQRIYLPVSDNCTAPHVAVSFISVGYFVFAQPEGRASIRGIALSLPLMS